MSLAATSPAAAEEVITVHRCHWLTDKAPAGAGYSRISEFEDHDDPAAAERHRSELEVRADVTEVYVYPVRLYTLTAGRARLAA